MVRIIKIMVGTSILIGMLYLGMSSQSTQSAPVMVDEVVIEGTRFIPHQQWGEWFLIVTTASSPEAKDWVADDIISGVVGTFGMIEAHGLSETEISYALKMYEDCIRQRNT